ncbi:MAG: DUF5683 domain-containing protein [bacterium]
MRTDKEERKEWKWLARIVCVSLFLIFQFSFIDSLQAQHQPNFQKPKEIRPREHSGERALCWSIIPGGGQIYNRQYWKVPIIYGAFAGMGYFIYYNYNRMTTFRDEYLYRVNHDNNTNLAEYAHYPTSNIYSLYNSYNRNFQLMVIITVGIYALNLIDAYVFGHLFDFRIDDDLSMNLIPAIQPMPDGLYPMLGLSFSF